MSSGKPIIHLPQLVAFEYKRDPDLSKCDANITFGMSEQEAQDVAGRIGEINRTVLREMQKPGMERVVPNQVFAVGAGPGRLHDDGTFVSPYATGCEVSGRTDPLMDMVHARLKEYGVVGVVGVDSTVLHTMLTRDTKNDSTDYIDGGYKEFVENVRTAIEIAEQTNGTKRPVPPVKEVARPGL